MTYPPNYKEIISINIGERPNTLALSEIFELEMGPNRCSILVQVECLETIAIKSWQMILGFNI